MGGIRRKIGQVAPAGQAVSAVIGAWPMVLARGADVGVSLALVAGKATMAEVGAAEVVERVPDHALLVLCTGPRGALGLMSLSSEVLAAVVERQTLGRVLSRPSQPRRPTRTDAAMAAGLVDGVLAALDAAAGGGEDAPWAAGFRMSGTVDEPRALPLMLDEPRYRLLAAELTLGDGARTGQILLALPAAGRGTVPRTAPDPDVAADRAAWQAALSGQVLAAETTLQAVLCRIILPLAEVMALAPGEVLRLGAAALDRIDLDGVDGVRLAGGRLGQNRGMRAIRLADIEASAAKGAGGLVPGVASVETGLRRTGTG